MAANPNLKELREEIGLTRDGVAKQLNASLGSDNKDANPVVKVVTSKAVKNWEMGRSEPVLTPKQMQALCKLYQSDLGGIVRAISRTKKTSAVEESE